jgi:hypothetical protein
MKAKKVHLPRAAITEILPDAMNALNTGKIKRQPSRLQHRRRPAELAKPHEFFTNNRQYRG